MRLLLAVVLLLSVSLAFGQSRVRGTITALQGDVLAVKSRDGKDLRLKLPSDVGVSTPKAAKLEELQQPDGTLSAPRISVSKDGVNPPH